MAYTNQYGTEVRVRKQSNEYVFEVASASPNVAPIVMMLTSQMVDEMIALLGQNQPWTYIRGNVTYSVAPNNTASIKLFISVASNETGSEPKVFSWVSSTFSAQNLIAAVKEAV